jgi:hypothetical protein
MSNYKFMSMGGSHAARKTGIKPEDAFVQAVWMEAGQADVGMFNEVFWLVKDCENETMVKGGSDELLAFISGDIDDPENLGGEVELYIENDKLTITHTSIVLIPKGAAHGKLKVTGLKKPIFCYRCLLDKDGSEEVPAEATVPAGTYSLASNVVEKYVRADGTLPFMPFEGFLKLLLWIDGAKLPGAPYMEAVWFCQPKPEKDEMDIPHTHEFDEFLGCIGSDPEHPEDLGGEVHIWVDGEELITDKSFLLCIPKGMHHCPMLIPKMERPIIHFTGGNSGNYNRG